MSGGEHFSGNRFFSEKGPMLILKLLQNWTSAPGRALVN
jgi:hypothetical protein